jgi:hypothetical protein
MSSEPRPFVRNPVCSLCDLPLTALNLVIKYSCSSHHHPLLRVCRQTRDLVLQHCLKANLNLGGSDSGSNCGALARLLQRLCSQPVFEPRLELKLNAKRALDENHNDLLYGLLERGMGRWVAVRKVTLVVSFRPSLAFTCVMY